MRYFYKFERNAKNRDTYSTPMIDYVDADDEQTARQKILDKTGLEPDLYWIWVAER